MFMCGSGSARVVQETVLRALFELDRWTQRQVELRDALARQRRGVPVGGRTQAELRAELDKVNRQVSYYQALAQDMKRTARPARVSDLLRTLFKA